MKPKLGRELALISLPLLIIGAAAWLLAGSGRALLPAPAYNGPTRLEFSPFEPVELSALEVYRGTDWSSKTSVRRKGKLQVPAALKSYYTGESVSDGRIVYRVGKTWKRAPALPGNLSPIAQGFGAGGRTLDVDLATVPAAAQEIRLRGKFTESHYYRGVWPAGATPPANYSKVRQLHSFKIESKPFDVSVQAPGQARPRPTASRETGVSVVKASYESDIGTGLRVHLRRDPKFGKPTDSQGVSPLSIKVIDATGQKIDFCDAAGNSEESLRMGPVDRDGLNLPDTDFAVRVGIEGRTPCGGWKKYRGPFTLQAAISDEQRWPVIVKVPITVAR